MRNPESWALESGIQVPLTKDLNPVAGIRNPRHGVHNPRLYWIPLHGAKTREEGWDNMYNSWFMKVGMSNFHCGNHKRYHLYHVISSDILIVIRSCGFKKMFERARIAEFTL